jgi:flagellar hook-associated protein 1 FlgK
MSKGSSSGTAPVNPNATPDTTILEASGQDITSQISSGTLGGLLNVRNTVLPSLRGDGQQTGALNQLAKQVADRVNQLLQSGQTSSGQAGTPLFTYDSSNGANVAATLALNPNATANSLAAVDPGPPTVSNGIALALSNLGTSTAGQDTIGGQSILSFYGSTAAQVGALAANAQTSADTATQSLTQAQSFRNGASGVSLDREATRVMELQRGYQAASQLIGVVSTLTNSLMTMLG